MSRLNLEKYNVFVVLMKIIIVRLYSIEIISLLSLPLYHLGHRAVEQGLINLTYCFGDNLLTILYHHQYSVDLS